MRQYLDAYFSGSLPDAVIDAVADPPDLEAARAMLERCWAEEPGLRFRKAGATGNGAGDQAGVSVEERAKEALEIRCEGYFFSCESGLREVFRVVCTSWLVGSGGAAGQREAQRATRCSLAKP